MTTYTEQVLNDFDAEARVFRAAVAELSSEQWEAPTPAEGWSVRDQVAHLAFVFGLAATAASDEQRFVEMTKPVASVGFQAAVEQGLLQYNQGPTAHVLRRWDQEVENASRSLRSHDPETPVPWLVNDLTVPVLAMAGMLELFAHGQDVADAVGLSLPRTDRIAHLVRFVHRTRDFGYQAHGLDAPSEEFRFEVLLPSGGELCVGPQDASDVVRGSALELCLVAARRRHPDDTGLTAVGEEAQRWLPIAQAYRGPAGSGRAAAA